MPWPRVSNAAFVCDSGAELLHYQGPKGRIGLPKIVHQFVLGGRIESAQLPQFRHDFLHGLGIGLVVARSDRRILCAGFG